MKPGGLGGHGGGELLLYYTLGGRPNSRALSRHLDHSSGSRAFIPDEDLPADFEAQRTPYYQALNLPLEPDRFIADLQAEMRDALQTLDAGLPSNPHVRISRKHGSSWITLTPFDAQPEPPNLTALKAEITATWPMTSLLDMVKEADLRLGFTDTLKSPTAYESLDRTILQPRLLFCLHGLGTNTGLQRMAGLRSGVTYKDLAYVRRRYIGVDALRRAIAIVTNGHAACPQPGDLGRRDYRLRVRFQALRRVGPEPHDPVARPLRRSWHHDLLACRAEIAVHLLAAQVALLVRGGVDDRGRDPPLHRNGSRSPVC